MTEISIMIAKDFFFKLCFYKIFLTLMQIDMWKVTFGQQINQVLRI